MNFDLTEDNAIDLQGALFIQLLQVRQEVKDSYGNVDLLARLEILFQRLINARTELARLNKPKT